MKGHGPFLGDRLSGQVDQFQQGHVAGEGPLALGYFPDLTVVGIVFQKKNEPLDIREPLGATILSEHLGTMGSVTQNAKKKCNKYFLLW